MVHDTTLRIVGYIGVVANHFPFDPGCCLTYKGKSILATALDLPVFPFHPGCCLCIKGKHSLADRIQTSKDHFSFFGGGFQFLIYAGEPHSIYLKLHLKDH